MGYPALIVTSGESSGLRIDITSNPFSIGRESGNNLILSDTSVSRVHARIEARGNGFVIIDTSSNGTFVNGSRVQECVISNGDQINFVDGRFAFRFLAQEHKQEAPNIMHASQPQESNARQILESGKSILNSAMSVVASKLQEIDVKIQKSPQDGIASEQKNELQENPASTGDVARQQQQVPVDAALFFKLFADPIKHIPATSKQPSNIIMTGSIFIIAFSVLVTMIFSSIVGKLGPLSSFVGADIYLKIFITTVISLLIFAGVSFCIRCMMKMNIMSAANDIYITGVTISPMIIALVICFFIASTEDPQLMMFPLLIGGCCSSIIFFKASVCGGELTESQAYIATPLVFMITAMLYFAIVRNAIMQSFSNFRL